MLFWKNPTADFESDSNFSHQETQEGGGSEGLGGKTSNCNHLIPKGGQENETLEIGSFIFMSFNWILFFDFIGICTDEI